MAEENLQQQDPAIWAKFPWQKSIIVLMTAISGLFFINDRNGRQELKNANALIGQRDLKLQQVENKLSECQEGKTKFVTELLNNELALKLSKDTSAISKLIIKSLIKVNEQRIKESQNEKH